jgi:AcrR family transcriptional regulator
MKSKSGKKRTIRTVTQVRIIEAAVQLFARNGFKGASTREISNLAKVNEVTLFRYFPSKSDLFLAAAESRLSRVRMGRELQGKLLTNASLRVVIPLLTEFLLENFFDPPELARLLYVAGFEVRGGERMVREYLGPLFDDIHSYFQRCAAKGMMREVEPSIATLGMAGIVNAHQNFYRMLTGQNLEWNIEKSVPAYSDFLLGALDYKGQRSSPPVKSLRSAASSK